MDVLLIMLVIATILFWVAKKRSANKQPNIFSHWYHLIEQFNDSSQAFYASLESAINARNIPKVKVKRIDHHEGGMLSAKREYLRASRKEHVFDICAAPFGNGFFVSWWLGETASPFWEFMMKIPWFGPMLFAAARPFTYYKLDTTLMFQESIHTAVLEVVDGITKGKGLRMLTELERKPILRKLFE